MDPTIRALLGTPENPELVFRRTYRTSVTDLRRACTDADRLARWFGALRPAPSAVGDRFTAVVGQHPHEEVDGQVLRCSEDSVEIAWSGPGEPRSRVRARFVAIDTETSLLHVEHALAEPAAAPEYGGGWEASLAELARSVGADAADESARAQALANWSAMIRSPLTVSARIPAPIERVWAAWSSAQGLRTWWWRHLPGVQIEADVRTGGRYRIEAPKPPMQVRGTYLHVDRPHRLAFTWSWVDDDGATRDEAVDVTFRSEDEATLVTVRHTGPWHEHAQSDPYREGWEFVLGELAQLVD